MVERTDIRLDDCIVHKGQRCSIGYAIRTKGNWEVEAYLNSLTEDEVIAIWRILVELTKPQKVVLPKKRFRKLSGHIFEVKCSTGPRVFCFMYRSVWWLTHGHPKVGPKELAEQIEKAETIRKEHIVRFWGGG